MFKKFNTKTLVILMLILGGLILFDKLYKSRKEEKTFSDEFVKIDSALVNAIYIYPKAEKGKEIKLQKNGMRWELQNDKIKTAADSNAVANLLSQFTLMKSISLAGQDKSSWNELEVGDTSGTRIKILTSDNHTYDMVVGKFGYNPSAQNGLTYIRHTDQEAVYAVPGFLSFTVNQGFHSWRNKLFIKGNHENWTTLSFTYPSDSSFVLSKTGNSWLVNGEAADSAKTVQYLSQLSNLPGSGFLDTYTPSSTPVFTLTINGNNMTAPVSVVAYPSDSIQRFILHSSLNSDAYLREDQSQLTSRIFVNRQHFLGNGGQ